jgi:uncharacterized membrane protein YidH (DUF202 family)
MSPTSVTFESPVTPLDEDELVLVQPKLVFANERTFLAYMHAMLLLSGVALGMLNFGSKVRDPVSLQSFPCLLTSPCRKA